MLGSLEEWMKIEGEEGGTPHKKENWRNGRVKLTVLVGRSSQYLPSKKNSCKSYDFALAD